MRSRRFTAVVVVLLALFVAIAALSFVGGTSQLARQSTSPDTPARTSLEREHAGLQSEPARVDTRMRAPARKPDPRAREALRRDIVRALERRGVSTDRSAVASDERDDADRAAVGTMVDRIGNRPELLERFNSDFMPLADECMEQARERVPDLQGLVAMDVKLLAERDVGAIVEAAEPADINEVTDPELLECLQQTLMSMALPGEAMKGLDGLDGIMISLRADPDGDGAKPR